MTYGQLRLNLSKLCPGVDLELIDSFIQNRYTEILDMLSWKRLEGESVFQSPPSYQTGTVAVTQGSTAITGAGTTWTADMTGLMIRIASGVEFYEFGFVSATSATLDRPYESVGTSGASYRIDQAVFLLPASCRILRGVRALHRPKDLGRVSPAELNRRDPNREVYGSPELYAQTWDANTDPPIMQVELWPIPSSPDSIGNTLSFSVDYIYDAPALSDGSTPPSTAQDFLPWVRPSALTEGVQANVDRWRASSTPEKASAYLATAAAHEAEFNKLVKAMAQTNAVQRGAQPLRLGSELRRQVPGYFRKGPSHRGYTG